MNHKITNEHFLILNVYILKPCTLSYNIGIMPVSPKTISKSPKKFIGGGVFVCMLVMIACQLGIQSFVSKCIWIKNPKLVMYVGKFITTLQR